MMHTKIVPLLGLALFLTACGGPEPAPPAPAPQVGFPSQPPAPLPVENIDPGSCSSGLI